MEVSEETSAIIGSCSRWENMFEERQKSWEAPKGAAWLENNGATQQNEPVQRWSVQRR